MNKAIQVLIQQWPDESLREQVETTLKQIAKSRTADFMHFIEEQLFGQANVLPCIRLLPFIPGISGLRVFVGTCLFKISQITYLYYKLSQQCISLYYYKPQIQQVLENAIIAMDGEMYYQFFESEIPAELKQREEVARFYEKLLSSGKPATISHPVLVRFAALSARTHGPSNLIQQLLRQFALFGEAGFIQNCIILMFLTDSMDSFYVFGHCEPFQTEFAAIVQQLYAFLSNSNVFATRFVSLIFYFKFYRFINPLAYLGFHEFFVRQFGKLLEQFFNQKTADTTILYEMQLIFRSPLLSKMLGVPERGSDGDYLGRCFELVSFSLAQVLAQNDQISSGDFNRFLVDYNQQEILQITVQQAMIKNLVQMSYNYALTVSTALPHNRTFQKLLLQRLLSQGNIQYLFELLENSFYSQKSKVQCLTLLDLMLAQTKVSGFGYARLDTVNLANKLIFQLLFKDLKLVYDTYAAGFKQRDLNYYDKDYAFKNQVQSALMGLLRYVLAINAENSFFMDEKTTNCYLCLITDSYNNVFSFPQPVNQVNDAFILNTIENQPKLEYMLLSATIQTLLSREFQFAPTAAPQQVQQYYYLQMRQYYGCFSLLNLLVHGEHDNKVFVIYRFIALGVNFMDILAIVTMLLACLDFEEYAVNIVNVREVVLSFLNYLVQVSDAQLADQSVAKFFANGQKIKYSALLDNTDLQEESHALIVRQAQYFVTRLLSCFNFDKFNIKIQISYGQLFPGSKWRSYSAQRMHEAATSQFIAYRGYAESETAVGSMYNSLTEEYDVEQTEAAAAARTEKLLTLDDKVDDYVYSIFYFVNEIMTMVPEECGFQFYRRCYQTKLIQSTSCIKQRQVQFRLSLLGYFPTLLSFAIPNSQILQETDGGSPDSATSQLLDITLNSYELVQKYMLRMTDFLYLVEGISAMSIKAILLCIRLCASKFPPKMQLQILCSALARPSAGDIIQLSNTQSPIESSDTSAVFVPSRVRFDNSMINVLVQALDRLQETNAYGLLCYLCFSIIEQIDVIGQNSIPLSSDMLPSVLVVVQYLLENSSFGYVLRNQQLSGERSLIFSMSSSRKRTITQIYESNGISVLFGYFYRRDFAEQFPEYQLSAYLRSVLDGKGITSYGPSECSIPGVIGHCLKLWVDSVDNLIKIVRNARLTKKTVILIIEKIFTIMDVLQNNDSVQQAYDSQIGGRLLTFLFVATQLHFSGAMLREVLNYLTATLIQAKFSGWVRYKCAQLSFQYVVICAAHYKTLYLDLDPYQPINPMGLPLLAGRQAFGGFPRNAELLEYFLLIDDSELAAQYLKFVIQTEHPYVPEDNLPFAKAFLKYIELRYASVRYKFALLCSLLEKFQSHAFPSLEKPSIFYSSIGILMELLAERMREDKEMHFRLLCFIFGFLQHESANNAALLKYCRQIFCLGVHLAASVAFATGTEQLLFSVILDTQTGQNSEHMAEDALLVLDGQRFLEDLAVRSIAGQRYRLLRQVLHIYSLVLSSSHATYVVSHIRERWSIVFSVCADLVNQLMFLRASPEPDVAGNVRFILQTVSQPEYSDAVAAEYDKLIRVPIDRSIGAQLCCFVFYLVAMGEMKHEHLRSFCAAMAVIGYENAALNYLEMLVCAAMIVYRKEFQLFGRVAEILAGQRQNWHLFADAVDFLLESCDCSQLLRESPEFDFYHFLIDQFNFQQLPRVLGLASRYAMCVPEQCAALAGELAQLLIKCPDCAAECARLLIALSGRSVVRQKVVAVAAEAFDIAATGALKASVLALLKAAYETDDICAVFDSLSAGKSEFFTRSAWGMECLLALVREERITPESCVGALADALLKQQDKSLREGLLETMCSVLAAR